MKISIIIPAHNEQDRIGRTLTAYCHYFSQHQALVTEFIVVLNGCTDNTLEVVQAIQQQYTNIKIINLQQAGKGLAITAGFADAISRDNELIGFVDADMATEPRYFHDLIAHTRTADVIIASRYMPGAYIEPKRPFIKTWGRKIVYHTLIRILFKLNFYDYQCGAKLFKAHIIKTILPYVHTKQWAFDVELLYLCKLFNFTICEVPTTWFDQTNSKLRVWNAGGTMISSLFTVHSRHKNLANNQKK